MEYLIGYACDVSSSALSVLSSEETVNYTVRIRWLKERIREGYEDITKKL